MEILARIRALSARERRSINSELLVLIESGLKTRLELETTSSPEITTTTQLGIWEMLTGRWHDNRSTAEIVEEIYASRSLGRSVEL